MTPLRAVPLVIALAAGVGGDVAVGAGAPERAKEPRWTEVTWPFPMDQWGTGRAFRSK